MSQDKKMYHKIENNKIIQNKNKICHMWKINIYKINNKYIYIYTLLVWVSVCLFLCLFVSDKRENG